MNRLKFRKQNLLVLIKNQIVTGFIINGTRLLFLILFVVCSKVP